MTRKIITAIIDGQLYVDPADANEEKIKELKNKLFITIGKKIPVVVAPIKEWMPTSGAEALMKEAMRNIGGFTPKVSEKEIKRAFYGKSKHNKV